MNTMHPLFQGYFKFTVDRTVAVLTVSDTACLQALVHLWDRQTWDEKEEKATHWRNRRGFSVPDARAATDLATKVRMGAEINGTEIAFARRLAIKYRRQVTNIANGEG